MHTNTSFRRLVGTRTKIRFFLAFLVLVAHAFFVGGIAFYRDWFAQPVSEGSTLTVGITVTVVVIITMILLEWVYILVCDHRLDALQKKVEQEREDHA